MDAHLKTILDIHPSWRRILLSKTMRPLLTKMLGLIESDLLSKGVSREEIATNINIYICPRVENIFEAFRYFDANNLKCIIIGQDPYPNQSDAIGLSFSTASSKIPASLKNIFNCLIHQNIMSEMPSTGDLRGWARQGVLMLNSMLTRTMQIENGQVLGNGSKCKSSKHEFWLEFTQTFLNFMSNVYAEKLALNNWPVHVMLWGEDAKKLTCSYEILRWGHPSPISSKNRDDNPESFKYCDHFAQVDIDWSATSYDSCTIDLMSAYALYNEECTKEQIGSLPYLYDDGTDHPGNLIARSILSNKKSCVVFTDGGCKGNGKDNPTTSFGIWFPPKYRGQSTAITGEIYGEMLGRRMVWNPESGLSHTTTEMWKTSPRAELMAIVYALDTIYRTWDLIPPSNVIMIIDNETTLNTLDTWIYGWNDFSKKKNPDLIEIIWNILCTIGTKINPQFANILDFEPLSAPSELYSIIHSKFTCIWQKSHVDKKDYYLHDMEHVRGNEMADSLCNRGIGHHDVVYHLSH